MATKSELDEIRASGLEIIEVLTPYRKRQRVLCFNPDKSSVRPWVLVGSGCGWYFASEQEARDYADREHRRRA